MSYHLKIINFYDINNEQLDDTLETEKDYELMRSDIRILCWKEFCDELMTIILKGYPKG